MPDQSSINGSRDTSTRRDGLWTTIFYAAALALVLAGGGCASPQMKGTPFFSGEYAHSKGPAEERINLWPVLYYHEPALSVLWPLFEFTEDHTAVRPLFSVYGLDASNRQYNLLWPLVQFDERTDRNHVFPVFWGSNYYTIFPLYWHAGEPWGEKGGTDSLFPLWLLRRGTNKYDLFSPWPLVRQWSSDKPQESGSMVLPLYWHQRDPAGSRFYSLPWWSGSETNGSYWRLLAPLYYQASNATFSALATPFWAQGRSESSHWQALIPLVYWDRQQHTLLSPLWALWQTGQKKTAVAPWAISWWTRRPGDEDLWLLGGVAHANLGPAPGPHHVLPFYYRDAPHQTFLSLLCGWDKKDEGYFYPVTPLVGVRTGQETGSWFFPVYSYAQKRKSGEVSLRFLLLGGSVEKPGHSHWWFIPLFSWRDDGPLDSIAPKGQSTATYGAKFWCLPFCWYENRCSVAPATVPPMKLPSATEMATNLPTDRRYTYSHGTFPLWSYTRKSTPAQSKTLVKSSAGVFLYDYKHEESPMPAPSAGTNDYTRARVLWRLWHYECRNGDVSVDSFPTIAYDRKTDGFRQFSFLWRFYRYERAANGAKKTTSSLSQSSARSLFLADSIAATICLSVLQPSGFSDL